MEHALELLTAVVREERGTGFPRLSPAQQGGKILAQQLGQRIHAEPKHNLATGHRSEPGTSTPKHTTPALRRWGKGKLLLPRDPSVEIALCSPRQ